MPVNPISEQDQQRRLKLRVAAKLMLGVAALSVVYVFIAAIRSGTGEVAEVPTLRVSLADLTPGESQLVSWEGRPVLLYRRQDSDYVALRTPDARLTDVHSEKSTQPEAFANDFRSATQELFVAIAMGTDLGCSVSYLPPETTEFQGKPWDGGFVDTCRQSRYDTAGRVYEAQYADRNLIVPPYTFSDNILILGR